MRFNAVPASGFPKPSCRPLAAVLVALATSGCGSDDSEPKSECTRATLTSAIDTYLQALTEHDPARLKLAGSVKFTENGALREVGEGFWTSAGALQFHRNLLDPERCGSVTQAVMEEQGNQVIFGLRLKLSGQQIVEIESIVARSGPIPGAAFFSPDVIVTTPQPEWEEAVPEAERSTREQLNQIADTYFEGFETSGTAEYVDVPFADDCNRWENGVKTTNDDCREQFENIAFGSFSPAGITRRRYPVADVENGIAIGFALFAGTWIDFHMFKVRSGQIHTIQAVVGPATETTGWEEQEAH
jgi:hypothetical protein